jgi:arylsulfatase A
MAAAPAQPPKPNIIFVLADDLGIDGVSSYGGDAHKTPHIDALAASGLRFRTCYAAPLCGPSRSLLLTGRYAFRTGGLTNESWRAGGPGPKSANEVPIAQLLKQAGYATGHAGKWRQLGELPGDWGFDEFITDNTAAGWYWETKYNKNGQIVNLPEGTYGPDVIQNFTLDFIRRHKDKPFFFYYAMHLVHKPTVRTPDTVPGTSGNDKLYDDNIRYLDKQLGELVAELEKLGLRQNTLIVFSGDNGTTPDNSSPVNGRKINGWKGTLLEGGSRVPFIASWPAVTPAGKVLDDIVSFADPYATFAELAGAKLPDGLKSDSQSFAPQLRGEKGTPRAYAYVQLGARWYVREPGYKLNQAGNLFDLSDAPFVEKPIAPADDTPESKAARQRLTAVLAELNPAGGTTDREAEGAGNNFAGSVDSPREVGPWKSGDTLPTTRAPFLARKELEISAEIEPAGTDGVIVTQGGSARGYAVYLTKGKLAFAVRENGDLTTIVAKDPLGKGHFLVTATLKQGGALALLVDGKQVAEGKADGLIPLQPRAGFAVGAANVGVLDENAAPGAFDGKITNVRVKTAVPDVTKTTATGVRK